MTGPASPADTMTADAPVRVGEKLAGKYLITARLGQGADGTVYRALHLGLNQDRAIKFIRASAADLPMLRDRLRDEASLLAQLNHPNVVKVIDFESHETQPYLVMEFVEGLNLAEVLTQSGRLAFSHAVEIIIDVAEGLQSAAALGIIHRDVKPANILVDKAGTPKLADLGAGIVRKLDSASAERLNVVGTAYYMAPEQFERPEAVTHRSDIYALGATFYHILTGRVPFPGKNFREVVMAKARTKIDPSALMPPHTITPSVPPAASEVVLRMLAYDPDRRYQDYEELLMGIYRLREQMSGAFAIQAIMDSNNSRRPGMGSQAEISLSSPTLRPAPPPTRPPDIDGVLRQAQALIQASDRAGAMALLSPLKFVLGAHESFWLTIVRAAGGTAEALALITEGLTYLPASARLQQYQQQLRDKLAAPKAKKCVFCGAAYEAGDAACRQCGGVDALTNPDLWWTHTPARPDLVRKAVEAYERSLKTKPNPLWSLAAAMAHLNLRQFTEASGHLMEVARARPDIAGVGTQLRRIQERGADAAQREAAAAREAKEAAAREAAAREAFARRVAVVDDSATIRKLVELKLREFDYRVFPFADGEEAVAGLSACRPDLVLLDITMPGKDGYAVCAWIRSQPDLSRVPVVLLSGKDGLFDRLRGKMAGASAHIGKPFDADELLQVIDQHMTKAGK